MKKNDLYCPVRLYHISFDPIDTYFDKHPFNTEPDVYDGVRAGCLFDIQNADHVRDLFFTYLDTNSALAAMQLYDQDLAEQIKGTNFEIEVNDNRLWLHIGFDMKEGSTADLDMDRLKASACRMLESIQGNLVRYQENSPVMVLFEACANWFQIYNRSDLPDAHYYLYSELLTKAELDQPQQKNQYAPAGTINMERKASYKSLDELHHQLMDAMGKIVDYYNKHQNSDGELAIGPREIEEITGIDLDYNDLIEETLAEMLMEHPEISLQFEPGCDFVITKGDQPEQAPQSGQPGQSIL